MTRHRAVLQGEFVVFLIGMRIKKPWAVHRWLGVLTGMQRMLGELRPEDGLLHYERVWLRGPTVVQYWRSPEQLDRFAHGELHAPAWHEWNRRIRRTDAVGFWHETYRVRAGEHESVYVNLPMFGLAAAGQSA
jgi:hypothetical protein